MCIDSHCICFREALKAIYGASASKGKHDFFICFVFNISFSRVTEQTIGVPFLSDIPILKYLFSTTTTSREKTRFYMTVSAELLNTAPPKGIEVGTLKKVK